MTPRHLLSALLSILMVAGVGFFAWMQFAPRGLPFNGQRVSDQIIEIRAFPGIPLPAGIEEGDRVDMSKQSFEARVAAVVPILPVGYTLDAVIDRGPRTFTIPLSVVDGRGLNIQGRPDRLWFVAPKICGLALLCGIALLLLWRGRDRAAFGMGLWATTFLLSAPASNIPLTGGLGLLTYSVSILLFLAARVGFYIMVEARVAAALSRGQRRGFRAAFFVLLALGTIYALGGPLWQVATGSGALSDPEFGIVLTASYFIPIIMLFAGYRPTAVTERQRLRWMLVSGLIWVAGIMLQNTPFLGVVSGVLSYILLTAALLGFLYAVLRLRVVDIAVVIDRALVYGLVTTLVVGIIAAVNSLALRETLVPGAGLLLQVVVPLALGIVLGRVREYTDRVVERVFFRNKYLAERALRTFVRHVEHMEDAPTLLEAAVREIHRNLKAPVVAIYSAEGTGYLRVRQAGESGFPERLPTDDAALVALRAEQKAVDLADVASGLGADGCAFPMMVLGRLRGVLICANRPGEHYAADEKQLLTQVAREVGATWRILRARDNEAYVRAMAEGELSLKAAREQAKSLALSWKGA